MLDRFASFHRLHILSYLETVNAVSCLTWGSARTASTVIEFCFWALNRNATNRATDMAIVVVHPGLVGFRAATLVNEVRMKEETKLVSVAQEPRLIDDCLVPVPLSPFPTRGCTM